MGNYKKILIIISLLLSVLTLYAQASDSDIQNSDLNSEKTAISEESKILFDKNFYNNGSDSGENNLQAYQTSSGIGFYIRMIIVLILIVVAIYFMMRFFKKKANPEVEDSVFLRRAASVSLGPGKSLEIVTLLDNHAYVLGVTDSTVNLVAEIGNSQEEKELIQALNLDADKKQSNVKPYNFSDVLDIFTKKRNVSKNQPKKRSIFSSNMNLFSESERKVDEFVRNHEENSDTYQR